MEPTWVDTHCHLQKPEPSADLIQRARDAGVTKMICVGTDYETSKQAIEIANDAPGDIYATIGLHPHDAKNGMADLINLVDDTVRNNPTTLVAIGECGLDYYYGHSPKEIQQEVFANHIKIAKENNLALCIHTRDAWDDTFKILQERGAPEQTVIHCFSGSIDEARQCLDQGFYLSFSGIVTFKNANDIREAAEFCPIDRLLTETDSPFLAPIPYRGKPNEPAYVSVVARFIADLKGVALNEFASAIQNNAQRVFRFQ